MVTLCSSEYMTFINTAVREPENCFFCQVQRFGWGGTELQGQLGMETQGTGGNNYGSKWGRRVLIPTT